ncbi:SigB/SigF/SigG family RNA polymerase sigma factor [Rhodococcus oryzae]|uniref:SigB/SigF/SigG family RNA polymerase sigma factor n=1 Tax=Rhodococcus oryzae TaxID=2571143 RepID=A0ABY2RLI7_9NOCA|nr:SigB/SigF/SigG family RNA polymerase sigma factor [Rhodococcus oryzae]TJZ78526.1 SigB/SigF/SigG family RNA polymerase sigma factor [Rhodococcus oryzae]
MSRHSGPGSDEYANVNIQFAALTAMAPDDPARAAARENIVEVCLPLAEHIARRFTGRGEPHEDLVQVARLGLVNAVNRYDLERGTEFVAFAVPTIMGEVRRHFRDAGWALRVPRRTKELHVAIGKVTGALSQQLGRSPTPSEIASELGVSRSDVNEALLAGNAYQTTSVDAPGTDRPGAPPLAETVGDLDSSFDMIDNREALRPVVAALPERERTILMLRFFGNLTQTQIAEQVGVSQMHVSRILARTLASLRAAMDESG